MDDSRHPLLPTATPVLRRGSGSVQVGGVDSSDGLVVTPDGGPLRALLRGLDGRRSARAVLADAAAAGLAPAAAAALLSALRDSGLVVDLEAADLLASDAGPAAAARTAAELPSAITPGGTASRWRRRRAASVVVDGATRVGTPLAAVLAASGVGRVSVRDPGTTAAGDAVVGGLTAADEGRPRSVAAADAVRRASPLADLRPPPDGSADVVVLARAWAASDPLVTGLQRARVPHLVAAVRGGSGVVGPFVVPGRTSCLHCADLHRRDADPHWPELAAQLTAGETPPSGATTTCLLTAVTAALQVLAYLDGTAAPVTLDATLELRPPDPIPVLRRWTAHPSCGCLDGAAALDGLGPDPSRVGRRPLRPEPPRGSGSQCAGE